MILFFSSRFRNIFLARKTISRPPTLKNRQNIRQHTRFRIGIHFLFFHGRRHLVFCWNQFNCSALKPNSSGFFNYSVFKNRTVRKWHRRTVQKKIAINRLSIYEQCYVKKFLWGRTVRDAIWRSICFKGILKPPILAPISIRQSI